MRRERMKQPSFLDSRQFWPEAEIIAEPVKNPTEPRLLVRRRTSELIGADGSDLVYVPGMPVISLFTGAGGMDIGTEQAGFCTLVQHEYDQAACQTLLVNRPNYFRHAALIQGDIRQTPTSMLLGAAGLRVGEAHLVCGGPPCQGFSTANSHSAKGRYDSRNDLVFEYLRVIREAQPRFFVMENVSGFTTFPGKVDGKTYLETFLRAAYDSYYELVYGLLDAADYGVPQYRCRFICMGTRRDQCEIDGVLASLPKPTCFSPEDLRSIRQSVGLFGPTRDDLTWAPGVRYFPDRPVLIPPRPNADGRRTETFLRFYAELRRNEPDRIVEAPEGRAA